MISGFSELLRGANGGYEVNRVVGAFGGFVYVIATQAFVAWNIIEGREFDVTAYCLAFPGRFRGFRGHRVIEVVTLLLRCGVAFRRSRAGG